MGELKLDPPAIAAWVLGFALVAYLMLQQGGYDQIVHSELGVATWWIVLVGLTTGVMQLPLRSKPAMALLAVFSAYLIWTALSLGWTGSDERTATELSRVATYLGFMTLAMLAAAAGHSRHLLGGVTTAVGLVVALAVLSRLHPQWFPENQIGTFLPGIEIERRLAYPLPYSSAMGVLSAMAIPLLAGATAWSRTLVGQALAAAALPLAGFALVLASSGVGTACAIAGLATFVALSGDRLPKLGTLALGTVGTAIIAAHLSELPALDRGLPTAQALSQGDELLTTVILVCAGVALAQTAIGMAVRYGERPGLLQFSRARAWVATGLTIAVAAPIFVASGGPGAISDEWETFKSRGSTADQTSRTEVLFDTSSSGRYEFWESAARAGGEEPLKGFGPGTFEFYWAQDPEGYAFVRDAHSLYLENLAELGWIGFLLIVGLMLGTIGIGLFRSINASPQARGRIAAATATAVAFGVGAALDWIWEIAALPALMMLLIAVIAMDDEPDEVAKITARRVRTQRAETGKLREHGPSIAGVVVAIAAIAAIWFPLQGASDVRNSQIDVANGNLSAALASAEDAIDAQPYAASPYMQKALVLEYLGDNEAALGAAMTGTRKEASNWRNWATLSRLQAKNGNAQAAVTSFQMAQELNPRPLGGN